jgi:hypothetical protein
MLRRKLILSFVFWAVVAAVIGRIVRFKRWLLDY